MILKLKYSLIITKYINIYIVTKLYNRNLQSTKNLLQYIISRGHHNIYQQVMIANNF